MQYVLEEGDRNDWFESTAISVAFGVAVVVIALFVVRELTCEVPAVNLRLFKDPVFLSGTAIGALMFALLMATMFLLPLFMQTLLGFTATDAGFALMPRVIVMMVAVPIVGRIYNSVSPRIVIGLGVLFIAWGAYEMSHFTLQTGQRDIILALTTQGVGFACLFVPLSTVALAAIPRHQMADATGLNSLFRQIGGSIGLAIAATMLTRYEAQARSSLLAHVTTADPAALERMRMGAQAFMARGYDAVVSQTMALRSLEGTVDVQSTLLGFERLFLMAGLCFMLVLPLLFFLKTPKAAAAGPREKVDVHVEIRRLRLEAAHAGLVDLSRKRSADEALGHPPGFDQSIEVDAGRDPHSVEHVDEILGRQIAGRARRVGASSEPADARVEIANTDFQSNEDVGKRRPARVVHVHGELLGADGANHELENPMRMTRSTDPDRVAERNLIAAHPEKALDELEGSTRIDVALVRAAPHGRHVSANPEAGGARGQGRFFEGRERLVDALVHVLSIVRLARRKEYRDLRGPPRRAPARAPADSGRAR